MATSLLTGDVESVRLGEPRLSYRESEPKFIERDASGGNLIAKNENGSRNIFVRRSSGEVVFETFDEKGFSKPMEPRSYIKLRKGVRRKPEILEQAGLSLQEMDDHYRSYWQKIAQKKITK